jgi:hypothetical protein
MKGLTWFGLVAVALTRLNKLLVQTSGTGKYDRTVMNALRHMPDGMYIPLAAKFPIDVQPRLDGLRSRNHSRQ